MQTAIPPNVAAKRSRRPAFGAAAGGVRAWWVRFGALFDGERGRARKDGELAAELESHLQMHIEDNIRRGMTPEAARRDALMQLGGLDQTKEKVRERRGLPLLESVLQDVRFGLRMLRKSPGFTAVAVLTLALGIGATTAIFSVAYATLLAPLPYPEADRLVNVWSGTLRGWNSAGDFMDWKRQSTSFEQLAAYATENSNLAAGERPEFIGGLRATEGYYQMLGSPLALGRSFLPEEEIAGNEHVVILTHRLWERLGADKQIVGRTLRLDGELYRVVGVMSAGSADRWIWQLIVPLVLKPEELADHGTRYLEVTGRLKPGVTIERAQAELDILAAQEAKDHPESNQGVGAIIELLRKDRLPSERVVTIWLLLGGVGFLLVIACINVANLALARGMGRTREVALRGALGAQPMAVLRQFLTESLLLAAFGGLAGIVLGVAILRGLIASIPPNLLPAEADLRFNVPVLLFALTATLLAGALSGCAPAWFASRLEPTEVLAEGGRSGSGRARQYFRRVLVIAELGLALPLLAGSGLMIRSVWNLTHADLGVRTDHILSFYVDSVYLEKSSAGEPQQATIAEYYGRILSAIEGVPGVIRACAMTYLPLDSLHAEMPFTTDGGATYAHASERPHADFQAVTPGYFGTFGMRIVKGRSFTDADSATSRRVAMVNEAFGNRFLQGVDPLGQQIMMEPLEEGAQKTTAVPWQIVGVFHDVKNRGAREITPEIDVPFLQEGFSVSGIGIRTSQDPAAITKAAADAVDAVDPTAAFWGTRTMEQIHDEDLANDRFTMILFVSFAAIALLLTAVGIFGVAAYSAAQRSRELALRMALGAARHRVIAAVMREGLALASIGLGLGLVLTYGLARAMQSVLFGVGKVDYPTFDVTGLVLLLVALLGFYLPARRATKVDPMVALRYE